MKSLGELYRYFEHFQELRHELMETLEGWDTPTIVVFGPQNSGKSTLLERLAMIPLFPKGDGLCTRLPIRISMRTDIEESITLRVIAVDAQGKESEIDRISLKNQENISEIINTKMLGLLNELNKTTRGIRSDRLIEVELRRENIPNLDLLDLPGMVVNANKDDDIDLPQQTKDLVKKILKQVYGRAIYLAVSEAGYDAQQSLTLQVLQELKQIQPYCFGVLTKGDLSVDKVLVDRLQKSKDWELGYGYFVVVNEAGYVDDENKEILRSLEEMAVFEKEFFQENAVRRKMVENKQATSELLLDALSESYKIYLKENWAFNTIEKLKEKIKEKEEEIEQYGPEFDMALFHDAIKIIRSQLMKSFFDLMFSQFQTSSLKQLLIDIGFREENHKLLMGREKFIEILVDQDQDLLGQVKKKYGELIRLVFKRYVEDFEEILTKDRYLGEPITSLKIGRFENLIQVMIGYFRLACQNALDLLISQIEGYVDQWFLNTSLYTEHHVVLTGIDQVNSQVLGRCLMAGKYVEMIGGIDGGKMDELLIVDSSLVAKEKLRKEIGDLWGALEKMIELFGQVERPVKKKVVEKKVVENKAGDFSPRSVNGVGFNMVYCPEGEFRRGSDSNKIKMTKGFWMGETQVTQELWNAVMGWNPSHFKGSMKLPIESISWYDCLVLCNKLSELEGFKVSYVLSDIEMNGQHIKSANVEWKKDANGYRLPTEAEWEYSAKAGTELIYSGSNNIDEVAWYNGNSGRKTHEVKTKKPNSWGLYDMSGNVWEWCHDAWDNNLVTNENPVNWNNAPCARVLRGGSCWYDAGNSRVAFRSGYDAVARLDGWGLRLLRCEP